MSRMKERILRFARATLARLGYDLIPRDYYSPVPDLDMLPEGHFERAHPTPGLDLDLERQLALLERDLAPHIARFAPGPGFRLDNDNYESVDAEVLWAMVRHLRPRRIVELGSGWSTLITAAACVANATDGAPVDYRAYDPYPRPILAPGLPGLDGLEPLGAAEVPLERFSELEAGDVLFVDTTHTVKAGGDVNRIVLDILPRLAAGVVVHFHDVFLPYEYPAAWLRERGWYWAEQYLLQAYLAENPSVETLLAANALVRAHPDRVAAVVPSFDSTVVPGAYWLRRT